MKKTASPKMVMRFLAMGYEKDIFGSFAYEFELVHRNEVSTSSI